MDIRYTSPIRQTVCMQSALVSFKYNEDIINFIKEQTEQHFWLPQTKEWEIPATDAEKLLAFVDTLPSPDKIEGIDEGSLKGPVDVSGMLLDPGFCKTTPLPHQFLAIKLGAVLPSFLIGDMQGLGKTKESIDIAVWRKLHMGLKHCLIICGINMLKYNWVSEIGIHSNETCCVLGKKPGRKAEPSAKDKLDHLKSIPEEFFWITNIESLRMTKSQEKGKRASYKSEFVNELNRLIQAGEIGLVIVDELHKCRTATSAQGRGLLSLSDCPKIGLSGTFLMNGPLDLYVPLNFIGAFRYNSYQFKARYAILGGYMNKEVVGWQHMDELRGLVKRNMLRRTKDMLDLPPKLYKTELLEMTAKEKSLYREILQATLEECDKIENPNEVLAKLTRLRQVCVATSLVSSQVDESTKLDRLADIIEEAEANNEKVIVFTSFREVAKLVIERFKDKDPYHIWGQMNADEVEAAKNGFQKSDKFELFVGVIQAAGTGITLNTASIVVFLDLPWTRAVMEQAEDRAHRIGSKKTVTIISLLIKGSYEEIIMKKLHSKGEAGEVLIDGQGSAGISNSYAKSFLKEVEETLDI